MRYSILIFLLICTVRGFSQANVQVEYRSGIKALGKIFMHTRPDQQMDDENMEYKTNRYYLVQFSLDSSGKIKSKVTVVSTSMFDLIPSIIGMVKRTDGNWINHCGHDIDVVLPVIYLYDDDSGSAQKNKCELMASSFSNWVKNEIVTLLPITVTIYPTTH